MKNVPRINVSGMDIYQRKASSGSCSQSLKISAAFSIDSGVPKSKKGPS